MYTKKIGVKKDKVQKCKIATWPATPSREHQTGKYYEEINATTLCASLNL
jgi:hypothetical protein